MRISSLVGEDLHLTGGQLGVLVAVGPALHRPGDPDDEFVAQRVEVLLIADDHLRDTGGVTQIEEGHSAVVAATGHPAAQGDGLTNEFGVDLAGGVVRSTASFLRVFGDDVVVQRGQ